MHTRNFCKFDVFICYEFKIVIIIILLLLNPTQTNVCSKMIFINTVNILLTKKPDNSKGFIKYFP